MQDLNERVYLTVPSLFNIIPILNALSSLSLSLSYLLTCSCVQTSWQSNKNEAIVVDTIFCYFLSFLNNIMRGGAATAVAASADANYDS